MYKIVRKAALELQTIDNKKVVKVAGILRRLKNVFRQLTDKEYSSNVDQIRNQSMDLQSISSQLNQKIDLLLSSIKDGDVDSYESVLEDVKLLSSEMADELKKINQSANQSRTELEQNSEEANSPESVRKDEDRYGPETYRNKRKEFMAQKKEEFPDHDIPISEYLRDEKGNAGRKFKSFEWLNSSNLVVPPGSKLQIIKQLSSTLSSELSLDQDTSRKILETNWSEFENRMFEAIRNGTLFRVSTARPGDVVKKRNIGETTFDVSAQKFIIPGLDVELSARFGLNDLGMTGLYDKTINVSHIKKNNIYVRPLKTKKKADRFQTLKALALANQLMPMKIMPIDDVGLAKALYEGYRKVYGNDPSLEILGSAWAQATFEKHPSGLFNNNIGNIRATGDWIKSGKPYFIMETVELDENGQSLKDNTAKWRAYQTPADGAAGYWKLLNGRYKDAVEWMGAGDPVSAAVALGDKGYYTANKEKYSKNVGSIYNRFMKNVAPQLPMVKSSPTLPPSKIKPEIVDERFSEPKNKTKLEPKTEIKIEQSDKPQSSVDKLLGTLLAMGPVEKMVVKSMLETKLPKTDLIVSLGNLSAPFGIRLRYARALSNTLKEIIDADVSIHSDGNKIELQCSTLGSTYSVSSAVKALCDCVNVALANKTKKYSISYSVFPSTISKYAKLKV